MTEQWHDVTVRSRLDGRWWVKCTCSYRHVCATRSIAYLVAHVHLQEIAEPHKPTGNAHTDGTTCEFCDTGEVVHSDRYKQQKGNTQYG